MKIKVTTLKFTVRDMILESDKVVKEMEQHGCFTIVYASHAFGMVNVHSFVPFFEEDGQLTDAIILGNMQPSDLPTSCQVLADEEVYVVCIDTVVPFDPGTPPSEARLN